MQNIKGSVVGVMIFVVLFAIIVFAPKYNTVSIQGVLLNASGQSASYARGFVFDKDSGDIVDVFKTDKHGYYWTNIPEIGVRQHLEGYKHYNIFIVTRDGKEVYNKVVNIPRDDMERLKGKNSNYNGVAIIESQRTRQIDQLENITIEIKGTQEGHKIVSSARGKPLGVKPVVFVAMMASKGASLQGKITNETIYNIVGEANNDYSSGSYTYSFLGATITIPVNELEYGGRLSFGTYYKFYENIYEIELDDRTYTITKVEPGQWMGGATVQTKWLAQNNVMKETTRPVDTREVDSNTKELAYTKKGQRFESAAMFNYLDLELEYSVEYLIHDTVEVTRISPDITTYEYGKGLSLFHRYHTQ